MFNKLLYSCTVALQYLTTWLPGFYSNFEPSLLFVYRQVFGTNRYQCQVRILKQDKYHSFKVLDLGKWDTHAIRHYSTLPRIQKQLRKANCTYLSEHPEIRAIIRVIMHQVINANPENVRQFIANFFNCCRTPLLVPMINAQLKYVKEQLKRGRWSKFDGEMLFMEIPSTHSLLSTASTEENVHPLLTYALVFKKPDECGIDRPPN